MMAYVEHGDEKRMTELARKDQLNSNNHELLPYELLETPEGENFVLNLITYWLFCLKPVYIHIIFTFV